MLIFFWLALSVLCGVLASKNNRSGFGYFILALIISPLLCGLLLLIIGKRADETPPAIEDQRIKCPECAELILKEAKKCKHCGSVLTPES